MCTFSTTLRIGHLTSGPFHSLWPTVLPPCARCRRHLTRCRSVMRWRAAVEQGDLVAPYVLAAGIAVGGESVDAVRQQVREAHKAGADFIKVFSEVGQSNWRAAMDEARKLHVPVCGHTPADVSLLAAASAGQGSNEHLMQAYEACSAREGEFLKKRQGLDGKEVVRLRDAQEQAVLQSFDQQVCNSVAAALAKTKEVQVPTLVLPHAEAQPTRAQFRDDSRWKYLRPDEQTRWEKILGQPPEDKELARLRWEVSRKIVATLHKAGVRDPGRDRHAHAAGLPGLLFAHRVGAAD